MSKCKTTLISYEQYNSEDYKHPCEFYVRNACGDYVYFHTRNRAIAQEWCNTIYDGLYTVRSSRVC